MDPLKLKFWIWWKSKDRFLRKWSSKNSNILGSFSQKWSKLGLKNFFPHFSISLRGFFPKLKKKCQNISELLAQNPKKFDFFHYFELHPFWDTLLTKNISGRLLYHFFHVRNHPQKFRRNWGWTPPKAFGPTWIQSEAPSSKWKDCDWDYHTES